MTRSIAPPRSAKERDVSLVWTLDDEQFRGHDVWIADSGFSADICVQWNGKDWCYWPVDVLPTNHPLAGLEGSGFHSADRAKERADENIKQLQHRIAANNQDVTP
jgi:hypothetical protein